MTVDVTQADIDGALADYDACTKTQLSGNSAAECPVARAATRAFEFPVLVGTRVMWFAGSNSRVEPLPPEVRAFVLNFPVHRDKLKPFSFEVDL